jgi:hypothetical protein
MNESYLHTAPYEMSNEGKKRFLFFAYLHIEVFDVGSPNPKHVLHGLYP